MSDNKLIIIERVGNFQRTYHANARLKNRSKDEPKHFGSVLEVINSNIDAITDSSYNDHSSVNLKIGKAWAIDWDEIDERMIWLIAGWLEWPIEDVQVQDMNSQGQTTPRTIPVKAEVFETVPEDWVNVENEG